MSGTFRITEPNSSTIALWPSDPLYKRWTPQQIGTRGTREPIFAAVWRFECDFGPMPSSEIGPFFERRFIAGGLYFLTAVHPITNALVSFTGVAIQEVAFDYNDVERNAWVDGVRVAFSVNMFATGTP